MQKFGGVKFQGPNLGVNPQSFSHELCLYITRFLQLARRAAISRANRYQALPLLFGEEPGNKAMPF